MRNPDSKNIIRVGIIGGAGYTGGELIRLLIHHPNVSIQFVHSHSQAGKLISHIHADLVEETDMCFTNDLILNDIDVLFLCVAHGDAKKFLAQYYIPDNIKIIDLSNDHRATEANPYPCNTNNRMSFTYGLPEVNKKEIISAKYVANPGCFATAIQLGLLPLAVKGLIRDVYTTGITGSTGAGVGMSETSHFSWRANNIQAYKTLSHQHVYEVVFTLNKQKSRNNTNLNFIPWRGDFTRGIFVSSQLTCDLSLSSLEELYETFYADHPFTTLIDSPLFLKQVVNTNKCLIQLDKVGHQLVIHSAIDNLLKGASGQAVQNMNLMFGLEETTGLQLKANYF
jgi:N-acetyl-gamma-glutamyl-phosphate reductase